MSELLGGMSVEAFLRDYWQKRPLLVRQAIPGYRSPVSPEELAGLACEADVESRLILEKDGETPWQLEHGPFPEDRFPALPHSHWTLLVQEINKHVPEFALLQDRFNFIPEWRLDDVMVSFAPEAGSVGPHADNYDVFLLQAEGRRRWQISRKTPGPDELIPDLPLKIIRDFRAEEEWVLEPGDMLYLPPGVAHHGVALENCITVSVGFRAPGHMEMVAAFAHDAISRLDEESFYADPGLKPQSNPGVIAPEARAGVREFLRGLVADDEALDRWFGRFITTRPQQEVPPPAVELDGPGFRQMLDECGELRRSEYCRYAYEADPDRPVRLFVDGKELVLKPELEYAAALLCGARQWPARELHPHLEKPGFIELLVRLHNGGCLYFPEE